jgi:hypothetical protein
MSDQDSGAPTLGLLQQKAARPIDPEQLEAFGKQAAARYQQGTPLSKAVVETVKTAKLAPEQLKRVCEFANTAAYLNEFEKGGEVRNVTFNGGPANPSEVLKDLNDGSAPAVHQIDEDYGIPSSGTYKTASGDDSLLAQAFGHDGMEKAASAVTPTERDHFAHQQPVEEVYDMKVMLDGTREHVMSKLASSQVVYDDVRGDLCATVRQAVHGGSSLGDIGRAWSSYTPNAFMLKEAMALVRKDLDQSGLMTKEAQVNSLKTVSGGHVPNPAHPVVEQFIAFTKVAHEHRKLERAVEVVDEQLELVNPQLRSQLS